MHVVKVSFDKEKAGEIWPSFTPDIITKHGDSGAQGARHEAAAIELIKEHFPQIQMCIDHSEDVVGQFYGIDFTLIKNAYSITVDVKGGSSGIYWDRNDSYWYITIKDDFFNKRKLNSHLMHVGPKGDLFVIYKKQKMLDYIKDHPTKLIPDKYGKRLKIKDLPPGAQTNIKNF